jgi:DNA-binding transcriptional LysR family regulator
MDLRDLRCFETIAELQHVGRAATKLNRTQPALTSCVPRLEEDCGTELFERAGRGIRLTAAGYVSRVLAEDAIVVAANANHVLFLGSPTLKDLTAYRWACSRRVHRRATDWTTRSIASGCPDRGSRSRARC